MRPSAAQLAYALARTLEGGLNFADPGRLREDDRTVAGLEHVNAVRKDRGAVTDDGPDERAGHRQFAKGRPAEPAFRPDGDVEYFETVALEHRELADPGVVCEPDHLLGGHGARVDRHVDSRALEDFVGAGFVDERDRESQSVHPRERRRIEILRVIGHGEDSRRGPSDSLALEKVRIRARGMEDPRPGKRLGHLAGAVGAPLDQTHVYAFGQQRLGDGEARLTGSEDD